MGPIQEPWYRDYRITDLDIPCSPPVEWTQGLYPFVDHDYLDANTILLYGRGSSSNKL